MTRQKEAGPVERPEYEKRWIVSFIKEITRPIRRSELIRQAYAGTPTNMRVRITECHGKRQAEMMAKSGYGISRNEKPAPMTMESAELTHAEWPLYVLKQRFYMEDGYEVNFYRDKLLGLIIVEYEMDDPRMVVGPPDWAQDPIEVTDTVCDEMLARLSYDFDASPGTIALREMLTRHIPKIVLTGAQFSGVARTIDRLCEEFPGVFQTVPNSISLFTDTFGSRPFPEDRIELRQHLRALGEIQRNYEMLATVNAIRNNSWAILLNRGTPDLSLWAPGRVSEIERIFMRPIENEYTRYDTVIMIGLPHHLMDERSPGVISVWDGHPFRVLMARKKDPEIEYTSIRAAIVKAVGL
jgi:CYTH domain-containing protein